MLFRSLGIAINSIADDCFKGKGAFEKSGAKKNFATIGVVYPEVLQIVSSEKIGAKSLADLKGKKVAIGPVGSGTASASGIVFGSAGIDVAKDIQAQRDSFGNATSKMQDGHIDASFAVLAVPASAITELQTAMPKIGRAHV